MNSLSSTEITYSIPKAEPDSQSETIRKTILSIIIPVAIAAFCWLVFNESPVFDTIVSIAMVIACFYMVNKCQTFKGTDYFVGTEGCVELSFDKNRNNIVSKKEVFSIHQLDFELKLYFLPKFHLLHLLILVVHRFLQF